MRHLSQSWPFSFLTFLIFATQVRSVVERPYCSAVARAAASIASSSALLKAPCLTSSRARSALHARSELQCAALALIKLNTLAAPSLNQVTLSSLRALLLQGKKPNNQTKKQNLCRTDGNDGSQS